MNNSLEISSMEYKTKSKKDLQKQSQK